MPQLLMRERGEAARAGTVTEMNGFESLHASSPDEFSVNVQICHPKQDSRGGKQMSSDRIVVELRLYDSGKLKAFADVTITTPLGEITVRGFRVVQDGAAAPWVAFPTTSYMKAGARINKQIVEVGRSLKAQVVEAILAAFRQASGGAQLPERA